MDYAAPIHRDRLGGDGNGASTRPILAAPSHCPRPSHHALRSVDDHLQLFCATYPNHCLHGGQQFAERECLEWHV